MALRIGIIGLPNVGKSTLFNALTRSKGALAGNYPFCTIDPNIGIVDVPDERLDALAAIVNPKKILPASFEFVDIAGLVKGASKGEGLGNKFLAAIREVDALCHIVRSFEDDNVIHVDGSVDEKRDKDTIETELILADLDSIDNRIDKTKSLARSGDKEKIAELALCEKFHAALSDGKMANSIALTDEEKIVGKQLQLLTNKPIIYAANISEGDLGTADLEAIRDIIGLEKDDQLILVSAKIEEDLQDLSAEDATAMLNELGVSSSGLSKLISAAYAALGYITYFTAGVQEVRAWNILKGYTAPQAAGVIHTDFEKGFIRAETIAYEDYIASNGEQGAKEVGKMRAEGKEYIVADGDVMHFRFNV